MHCQFQLIVGETSANKFMNVLLPVNNGLMGVFLVCFLLPSAHVFLPIVGILLLIIFSCVVMFELTGVKLFQVEGIIELDEKGIRLNGLTIQTADLQQVDAKFTFARGQGAGRSGIGDRGNRIIIRPKTSAEVLVATVLVEARAQRDNLAAVLRAWRKMGIKVAADGIDLA